MADVRFTPVSDPCADISDRQLRTKCGHQSLYSIASPGAPSQLRLKLLADEAVNRIGTAAADREEEASSHELIQHADPHHEEQ
jgi:hypothetical protein